MKKQIIAAAILVTIVIALGIGGTLLYFRYKIEKDETDQNNAEVNTIEDVLTGKEEEKSALEDDISTLEEQINTLEDN